jgi:hypothetical protein
MDSDLGGAAAGGALALFGGAFMLFWLALVVLFIASAWKVFAKAGQPGWAAIIPIYNIVVLLQIVGRPIWWLLLFCIPLVNFVIAILVYVDLAKSFGQSTGFAIGLLLLAPIFWPILGFGGARYIGPAAVQPGQAPVPA